MFFLLRLDAGMAAFWRLYIYPISFSVTFVSIRRDGRKILAGLLRLDSGEASRENFLPDGLL